MDSLSSDKKVDVEYVEATGKNDDNIKSIMHDTIEKIEVGSGHQIDLDAIDDESLALIIKSHPVDNWSKSRIRLYLTCVCLYLCSTCNGFDGSLMTRDYFNLKESASGTGLVFSIYTIGAFCATVFIWLCDYVGRVKTIFIGLVILLVGAILTAVTSNHEVFIFGRFLLSFGATISFSSVPIYLMEVLPPDLKHLAMFYNVFYSVGQIISTWTMYGTSIHLEGTPNSFKIALWLQILCPGIVVISVWWFPESPRFLYSKNRIDEAKDFIVKYHANGDETHPIVIAELHQIDQSFRESGFMKIKDYFDISIFFKTKAGRKRAWLASLWALIPNFCGGQIVSYYSTNLYISLGITNATTRLLLVAINSIISLVCGIAGGYYVEKIGRRPLLIIANLSLSGVLVAVTVSIKCFEDNNNNTSAATSGVVFMYLFSVFFSFCITPIQPTYPTEIMSNKMRVRGMAFFNLISNAVSTLNIYTAPVAMQNIDYWYFAFFAIWDVVQCGLIYFFFVETAGLSLEEVEHVFNNPKSIKESIRLSKLARTRIKLDGNEK